MRATALLIVAMMAGQAPLAQNPPAAGNAAFDVVSVRPSRGQVIRLGWTPGGGFMAISVPPRALVTHAYPEMEDIVGLPEWAALELYEVLAKPAPGPAPTAAQRRAMVRALLEDRFAMISHVEMREMEVFHLLLARGDGQLGPWLKPSSVDCFVPLTATGVEQGVPCRDVRRGNRFEGETTLASFARVLRDLVGRRVIDHTGLAGLYRITFESSTQPVTRRTIESHFPSVFTALREQLGLKLEAARSPVEVLVIDRFERPTPN